MYFNPLKKFDSPGLDAMCIHSCETGRDFGSIQYYIQRLPAYLQELYILSKDGHSPIRRVHETHHRGSHYLDCAYTATREDPVMLS